jgi:uncharacterized protein (DUF58 family)
VAKTGQLMIRQDESTRRSTATIFLDNRSEVLGKQGSPGFERAVSAAASMGIAFVRAGFASLLATAEGRPHPATEEGILEAMAAVSPTQGRQTPEVLKVLRAGSLADTTLAYVSAPPSGADLPSIIRLGTTFGRKVAVFVYPVDPASLSASAAEEVLGRGSGAQASLVRAGWEVFLLSPDGMLGDLWQRTTKTLRVGASTHR